MFPALLKSLFRDKVAEAVFSIEKDNGKLLASHLYHLNKKLNIKSVFSAVY